MPIQLDTLTLLKDTKPQSGDTLELPPHGYVRYVDHLGTDTRIVEAARISYGSPSKGEEADRKLISRLFRDRHTSPFEQCNITFDIKMPIFCMRQLVRHRTFRLNEYSGRYSQMPDEFYAPPVWRRQGGKENKQGSVEDTSSPWNMYNDSILAIAQKNAYDAYQALLEHGVARELARIVLPVSNYTEIYVNCDLHNLIHFFYLRTDPHAQKEIQDIAWAMLSFTERLFPWTMELWHKFKPVMQEGTNVKSA